MITNQFVQECPKNQTVQGLSSLVAIQSSRRQRKFKTKQVKFFQELSLGSPSQSSRTSEIVILMMSMQLGDGNKLKKIMKKNGMKERTMPLRKKWKEKSYMILKKSEAWRLSLKID